MGKESLTLTPRAEIARDGIIDVIDYLQTVVNLAAGARLGATGITQSSGAFGVQTVGDASKDPSRGI